MVQVGEEPYPESIGLPLRSSTWNSTPSSSTKSVKSFRNEAKNYLTIRSKKPKLWWLLLGLLFLIVFPFSIFITSDDIFEVSAVCFISSILGFGFILLSSFQYSSWWKLVKSARETIETRSKIPFPDLPNWPQILALISLLAGLILQDLGGFFALVGFFFCLVFSGITAFYDYKRNKAYDRLVSDLARK